MEKVIYNLVFNRKKQLNAEGKALIQVEAYLNRQINPAKRNVMVVKNEMRLLKQKRNVLQI